MRELFTPAARGEIPQGRVLPCRVVAVDPSQDDPLGLLKRLEMVQPDTLLLQGTEEALDDPVVLRGVPRDELLGDRELMGSANKEAGEYADVPGFCQSAPLDDGEPFEEKMQRLTATLREQQAEAVRLDAAIAANNAIDHISSLPAGARDGHYLWLVTNSMLTSQA